VPLGYNNSENSESNSKSLFENAKETYVENQN
jgi:hypothetical protein